MDEDKQRGTKFDRGTRLVPSHYLSVFWSERRLGISLRRAPGLMGREEGKIVVADVKMPNFTFCGKHEHKTTTFK